MQARSRLLVTGLLTILALRLQPCACLFGLRDQHVEYHILTGSVLVGDVVKQLECHVFFTLYIQGETLTLRGFLLPNENRHQGGFREWYLDMPEDVAMWDPHLLVTTMNGSIMHVATDRWVSWAGNFACGLCMPLTFNLDVAVDTSSQLRTLQIADWHPITLPSEVPELHSQRHGVVVVYSHMQGLITFDKVAVLHTHLMYHQQLGVQQFWLYGSHRQIRQLSSFDGLKPLLETNVLQLVHWPDKLCDQFKDCAEAAYHPYKHQILVYNAARLAGIHAQTTLLVLDTDEYLITTTNNAEKRYVGDIVQQLLPSHSQLVLTRYGSYTCRDLQVDVLPDVQLLNEGPATFLNQFRTRSQDPYIPVKGKSMMLPDRMAVYEIHLGVELEQHMRTTLWLPSATAYILHLANLWSIRECQDTEHVETIPAWAENVSWEMISQTHDTASTDEADAAW